MDRTAPDWPLVLEVLHRLHQHIDKEEHGLLPLSAWERIPLEPGLQMTGVAKGQDPPGAGAADRPGTCHVAGSAVASSTMPSEPTREATASTLAVPGRPVPLAQPWSAAATMTAQNRPSFAARIRP